MDLSDTGCDILCDASLFRPTFFPFRWRGQSVDKTGWDYHAAFRMGQDCCDYFHVQIFNDNTPSLNIFKSCNFTEKKRMKTNDDNSASTKATARGEYRELDNEQRQHFENSRDFLLYNKANPYPFQFLLYSKVALTSLLLQRKHIL